MSDKLTVKANTTLIPFLASALRGWSRSTINQALDDSRYGRLTAREPPVPGLSVQVNLL